MIATGKTIKVASVSEGVNILLSPEALTSIGVKDGDSLSVETTSSGIRIMSDRAAKVLAIAERVMREDREVLRRLAE